MGESKAAVEEAVSLVEITYGEEAPVIGLSSARETENALAFEKEVSFGEYDKAEREAAVIVTHLRILMKTEIWFCGPHARRYIRCAFTSAACWGCPIRKSG